MGLVVTYFCAMSHSVVCRFGNVFIMDAYTTVFVFLYFIIFVACPARCASPSLGSKVWEGMGAAQARRANKVTNFPLFLMH